MRKLRAVLTRRKQTVKRDDRFLPPPWEPHATDGADGLNNRGLAFALRVYLGTVWVRPSQLPRFPALRFRKRGGEA